MLARVFLHLREKDATQRQDKDNNCSKKIQVLRIRQKLIQSAFLSLTTLPLHAPIRVGYISATSLSRHLRHCCCLIVINKRWFLFFIAIFSLNNETFIIAILSFRQRWQHRALLHRFSLILFLKQLRLSFHIKDVNYERRVVVVVIMGCLR